MEHLNALSPRLRRHLDSALDNGKTLLILRHINDGHLLLQHEDIDNPGEVAGGMPAGYRLVFVVRPATVPSKQKKTC